MNDLEEDIQYYLDNYAEPDFVENEGLYDDLDLTEEGFSDDEDRPGDYQPLSWIFFFFFSSGFDGVSLFPPAEKDPKEKEREAKEAKEKEAAREREAREKEAKEKEAKEKEAKEKAAAVVPTQQPVLPPPAKTTTKGGAISERKSTQDAPAAAPSVIAGSPPNPTATAPVRPPLAYGAVAAAGIVSSTPAQPQPQPQVQTQPQPAPQPVPPPTSTLASPQKPPPISYSSSNIILPLFQTLTASHLLLFAL